MNNAISQKIEQIPCDVADCEQSGSWCVQTGSCDWNYTCSDCASTFFTEEEQERIFKV